MFPGCEKNLLIVKNRERRFSNIKVYENNLQTLQNDFADFQDAMSKGAQFVVIDSNSYLPQHYAKSFEVLATAIMKTDKTYRPGKYASWIVSLNGGGIWSELLLREIVLVLKFGFPCEDTSLIWSAIFIMGMFFKPLSSEIVFLSVTIGFSVGVSLGRLLFKSLVGEG
jgi:hypothetical protein